MYSIQHIHEYAKVNMLSLNYHKLHAFSIASMTMCVIARTCAFANNLIRFDSFKIDQQKKVFILKECQRKAPHLHVT